MNRYMLYKNDQIKKTLLSIRQQLKQRLYSSSSSSSSSSDDEKKKHEVKKRNEALEKLNNLLNTMIKEDVDSNKMKLNLAKPTDKRKKNRTESQETKSTEYESNDKQLKKAVKDVAESLGGDVKKTESELLMKLLKSTDEKAATSLSELVKGMKIDHEQLPTEKSKAQQVRQILQTKSEGKYFQRKFKPRPSESFEKIDLFGSKPLGIFQNQSDMTEGTENKIWNKLLERDLKLAVTHPPSNYFQQMILWTEQEKIWKFPIDNEQGLDEEKKIYFTEHVFLDKYLEPWCPPKGPLRHFMELVCVGLSKNPYLTVEAKKEHIMWFKNYFEEKKQLLKETGVIQDIDSSSKENIPKQIE